MNERVKQKLLNQKWERLEKEGLTRPKTLEENRKRIRAAHGQD